MEWTPIIDCAYDVDFTIADPGATMLVTIQLKDFEGKSLNVKAGVMMYITSDAGGNTLHSLGTDAVVATHGFVNIIITNCVYYLITEDTGIVAVTLDGASAASDYVNIVLPNGKVVTSGAVAFNA